MRWEDILQSGWETQGKWSWGSELAADEDERHYILLTWESCRVVDSTGITQGQFLKDGGS